MRVVALVALVAVVVVAGADARADRRPTLAIGGSPLVVHGRNFRASERVLLFVTGQSVSKRVVRTDATGSFRLRLASSDQQPCRSLLVQAIGEAGDRASAGIGTTGCGAGSPQIPRPGS
jgi:hypothetical protein